MRQVGGIQDFQGSTLTQAQLLADGIGGGALVTGDHHGVDTGLMEVLDGSGHTLPDGVSHAHHAHPGQTVFISRALTVFPHGISNSQDAQGSAGHVFVLHLNDRPVLFRQGRLPAISHLPITQGQDVHRATLQSQESLLGAVLMLTAHEEARFRAVVHQKKGILPPQRGNVQSCVQSQAHQGVLRGRPPKHLPAVVLVKLRLIA